MYHSKKKKQINMATGGLMNMPPFIKKSEEEKEKGITAYDVNTPKEARQGLPSRLVAPSRTRFNTGGNLDLDGSGDTTMKDVLIGRGVIDADGNKITKAKAAYGGLMNRKKYNKGLRVSKDDMDNVLDPEAFEEFDIEDLKPKPNSQLAGDKSIKDNLINKQVEKLEIQKQMTDDMDLKQKIENQIDKLESMKSRKTSATGGLLQLSIGGEAATSERYDRRRDYQAYQDGDIVEDETLMSPPEMNPNMEMDEMEDEDMGDMDAVVDTSALSEAEEEILDNAVDAYPELEAIIPKIVATEFTEDGEVEGPGTGTSDSIPALLSDGEFVFTAKAVKNIGVDKLRKMMKDAEAAYDAGMQSQEADAEMADMQE